MPLPETRDTSMYVLVHFREDEENGFDGGKGLYLYSTLQLDINRPGESGDLMTSSGLGRKPPIAGTNRILAMTWRLDSHCYIRLAEDRSLSAVLWLDLINVTARASLPMLDLIIGYITNTLNTRCLHL